MRKESMTRTIEDILIYQEKAFSAIEKRFRGNRRHPNYKKLMDLLSEQITDELETFYCSN